ncbi:PCI domain-containing protein [Peribacillus muralis]|uniref:PCI domain-containing protein n=1 Tax=Peribacillus muralis TaxID=264697 RepID=UPI0038147214
MEKELLYQRVHSMIISSAKKPKYSALSTVKIADLFGVKPDIIEDMLQELINEGRLRKAKLTEAPNYEVYSLP